MYHTLAFNHIISVVLMSNPYQVNRAVTRHGRTKYILAQTHLEEQEREYYTYSNNYHILFKLGIDTQKCEQRKNQHYKA